jgi:hypothetical protein
MTTLPAAETTDHDAPPRSLSAIQRAILGLLMMTTASEQERLALHEAARRFDEAREVARLERELQKQLMQEARVYWEIISNRLANLGMAHLAKSAHISTEGRSVKRPKVKLVSYDRCFVTPEVVYFRVKVNRQWLWSMRHTLPFGTRVKEIIDPDTMFELSMACERPVTAKYDNPRHGAWLLVHRTGNTSKIVSYVAFREILEHVPADRPGAFILGVGEHRKPKEADLDVLPHVLIGGSTGGGKSNMVNNIICQLIRRNTPDELRLVLVDLKKLEFTYYEDLPHLLIVPQLKRPIITTVDETIVALAWLLKELTARTDRFARRAKDLTEWNRKYPDERLPRLVMIIDEFAQLILSEDKKTAEKVVNLTARITALGRAVGVNLIIATQRPDRNIVPGIISVNMSLRIAAAMPSHHQSQVITGTGHAAKLDPELKGRMLYMIGAKITDVQTPHVTQDDVDDAIKVARGRAAGVLDLVGHEAKLNPEGVLLFVVDKLQGSLAAQPLRDVLTPLGVRNSWADAWRADLIARVDQVIEVGARRLHVMADGTSYRISDVETISALADDPPAEHVTIDVIAEPPPLLALPAPATPEPQPPALDDENKPLVLMSDEELIGTFVKQYCQTGPRCESVAQDVYQAYVNYCDRLNLGLVGMKRFAHVLARQYRVTGRNSTGNLRMYRGIKLRSEVTAVA